MTRLLRTLSQAVKERWALLGALPARHVCTALVLVFSLWVLADVFALRVSSGLSTATYDAMVRTRLVTAAPDPRIVILDIDEASLLSMGKEFGRWPWPRDTLATVLDYLEKQQPAAIVWDIAFSDPDRLSPGGDKAFDEAVRRSPHSIFSVVRLPAANDGHSRLTPAQLPMLWQRDASAVVSSATPSSATPTAALIVPVLPAVAAARLGYNNGYPDADGVLRRYRYLEQVGAVGDGWALKSLPYAVAEALHPQAAQAVQSVHAGNHEQLMAWRRHANSYPKLSFASVFAAADGGKAQAALPSFAGKIVLIGSTAPSLHDIHPTPLSPVQAGVDSLATAIDNALNQRHLGELSRALQATLAIGLCVALAVWVRWRGVASLDAALFALPVALLVLSYASLNLLGIFIDLYLPAALALLFLAALRTWNNLRRAHWCDWQSSRHAADTSLALWACAASLGWVDARLDRLVDAVEKHLPGCRVLVADSNFTWPGALRWPELAAYAAVIGPRHLLEEGMPRLLTRLRCEGGTLVALPPAASRLAVVACALGQWSTMLDCVSIDENQT